MLARWVPPGGPKGESDPCPSSGSQRWLAVLDVPWLVDASLCLDMMFSLGVSVSPLLTSLLVILDQGPH